MAPDKTIQETKTEAKHLLSKLQDTKCVAGYVRVSTDAQAEQGYSIPDQLARLKGYCMSKGWDNVKYYTDPGFSGSNLDRPAMTELIRDVREGKIMAVVVFKLDRLSRSQKDTLYLIEDVFLPNNVDFISLSESLDTGSPFGRAMIGILSVFAQLERENIYARTRIGMLGRVSAGYWRGGGNVPTGYTYDKNLKTIVPNEDAEKVRKAFDLYIKGYSCQAISDMLGFKGDRVVSLMLDRHTYCGYVNYKGKDYPGIHEPIISEETFQLAAEAKRRRSKKNLGISGENKFHLLTGLIHCGDCGARMRYMEWGQYYKVMCYSRIGRASMKRDPNCPNYGAKAFELENLVLSKLFSLSVNMEDFESKAAQIDPIRELENQERQATAKLRRLYDLISDSADPDGDTLDPVLVEQIVTQRNRIKSIQQQKEAEKKHRTRATRIARAQDHIKNIGDVWEHLTPMEKQNLIRDCVEKVNIYHDGRVEIFYTFATIGSCDKKQLSN